MNATCAHLEQRIGPAQAARRRPAYLHMRLRADRRKKKHRVERCDLKHADPRHVEEVGDVLDRLLRQPAPRLLLRAPEQRDYCGLLAAGRIFRDLFLRPRAVLRREGKLLRLKVRLREAADAHRSTSPNTMSSEPRIAETSASMWPRQMKSMACRCAKPGARILHL